MLPAQALARFCYFASLVVAATAPSKQILLTPNESQLTVVAKRIAIIGAGSGGSSTAYYLKQYADNASIPINITVYERESYIGGRSTTVHAYDDPSQPVELGASIFVRVNRNLVAATTAFNLSTASMSRRQSNAPDLGVWDGNSFVLILKNSGGWWDIAKLIWKYGMAPKYVNDMMKATVGTFLKMYDPPYFPFASLSDTAQKLGLDKVASVSGEQLLKTGGIGGSFGHDVVQASTRVNYAQDLAQIHGLEAMVCMATDGAMSIAGGNWRIFEGMLNASHANVKLGWQVGLGKKDADGSWTLSARSAGGGSEIRTYDEIVLAGPKQFSGIQFPVGQPRHRTQDIAYVHLFVTLLASKHPLLPAAFNLPSGQPVPQTVLTTLPSDGNASAEPDFFSISNLREVTSPTGQDEYLYKVFSRNRIQPSFLARILGISQNDVDRGVGPDRHISWMYEKEWLSYPYEIPRSEFENIKLDEHFWYTSGIESFISTMETSSLMGMNVARLIVDEWTADTT